MTNCAAALLYQWKEGEILKSVIVPCLICYENGDNNDALKAKAERYVSERHAIRDNVSASNLVAWDFVIDDKAMTG